MHRGGATLFVKKRCEIRSCYKVQTINLNLRKKMMKKKIIRIFIIIVALMLMFPFPISYKDGGTVKYQAVLYSITDYHAIRGVEEYDTGIEIKIIGITVYENTTFEK